MFCCYGKFLVVSYFSYLQATQFVKHINGGGEQIAPVGGSRTAPGLPSMKNGPGSKPTSPISRPSIPANGKTSHFPKLSSHNHVSYKPASPAPSFGSSCNSPGLPHIKSEPIMHSNLHGTPIAAKALPKTNAANKKRRQGDLVDSAKKVSRLDDGKDDDSIKSGSSRVSDNINGLVRSGSFETLPDTPTSVYTSTPVSGSSVSFSARHNASFLVKTESELDKFTSSMLRTSSCPPEVASTVEPIAKLHDKGLNQTFAQTK